MQLLRKGEEHRSWILKKYRLPDPLAGNYEITVEASAGKMMKI